VSPATGAALVFAGLLSVVLFPVGALALLGRLSAAEATADPAGPPELSRPAVPD
jgi:hypothetical protein